MIISYSAKKRKDILLLSILVLINIIAIILIVVILKVGIRNDRVITI